jgi:hypothetical protein
VRDFGRHSLILMFHVNNRGIIAEVDSYLSDQEGFRQHREAQCRPR